MEKLNKEKIYLDNILQIFNEKYEEYLDSIFKKIESITGSHEPHDNEEEETFETEYVTKTISKEDNEILRMTYKKAAQLCHPDKVNSQDYSDASFLFKRLQKYYKAKKIKDVNAIYSFLKSGCGYDFSIENINDYDYLKYIHRENEDEIEHLEESINDIRKSQSYHIIENNDLDEYFKNTKGELEKEYQLLIDREKEENRKKEKANFDQGIFEKKTKPHKEKFIKNKQDNTLSDNDKDVSEDDMLSSNNILLSVTCFLGDFHVEKDKLALKNFIFRKGVLYITRNKILFHKKNFLSFGLRNEINIRDISSVSCKTALLRNIITFHVPSNSLQIEVYSSEHAKTIIKLTNDLIINV